MKKLIRNLSFFVLLFILLASTITVSARRNEITFIENSGIIIENDVYFTGMPEETKVKDISDRLTDYSDIVLRDNNGTDMDKDQFVGTGSYLSLVQFNVVNKKLTAVVLGDTSGDGKISSADYLKIKKAFTNTETLEGAFFKAADINKDGRISSSDYVKIKKHIAKVYDLHEDLPAVSAPPPLETTPNPFTLGNSVEYANQVKNQVDTYFKDNGRTSIVYENATMKLTHGLMGTGEKQVQEFSNKDGGVYFTDSFVPFIKTSDSVRYLKDGADTDANDGTPVIRFGQYYYQNEIRHVNFVNLKILRVSEIYNVLPDSLRVNQRLIVDETASISDVYIYGNELKLPVSTVASLEIKDSTGTYAGIENYDKNTVEYVAFDIKEAGVLGLIFATDSLYETVEITVEGDYYVIRSYMNISSFTKGTVYNVAMQLYNDTTHNFEGVRDACYLERNPITVTTAPGSIMKSTQTPYYNSTTGLYTVPANYDGGHNNTPKDVPAYINVIATNDDHERPVYIQLNSDGVAMMATGIVRDGNGKVTAIPAEFCRNFSGDDAAYEADHAYGDIIYPLYMEENESITTMPTVMWNKWGNAPFMQFSSIQYYFMYSHTSLNRSETTCITPSGAGGYGGNIVADFRGVSGDMWQNGNPQYNHGGNFYFANENNIRWNSRYEGMDVHSSGPNYVDVSFDYIAESRNFKYTLNHKQFPSEDESRNYYTIDITFLKDTDYKDANKNFQILQYYTSMGNYNRMVWLDDEGKENVKVPRATVVSLNSDGGYFSFYNNTSADTMNMAILVKDYSVTMAGEAVDLPIGINVFGKSSAALVINEKNLSFKAGDRVTFNVVLVPYGNPSQEHYDNVTRLYQNTIVNPLTTTVTKGSLFEDAFMPMVYAENNSAEFTLSGGADNVAVRIDGFTSDKVLEIEEYVNGQWVPFVYYSEHGYDGYNIYYNEDNTYGFSYTVPMGTEGKPRQFRVSQ